MGAGEDQLSEEPLGDLLSDAPATTLRASKSWMPATVDEERSKRALLTNMIEKCIRLTDVPIASMSLEDLRLLLGQQISPEQLVPLALRLLSDDPLLEATFFEGDLLLAVLKQSQAFWQTHPRLLDDIRRIVPSVPDDAFDQDFQSKRTFELQCEKLALI